MTCRRVASKLFMAQYEPENLDNMRSSTLKDTFRAEVSGMRLDPSKAG